MSTTQFPFPHSRLDVYQVALKLARQCKLVADRAPRGFRKPKDNLLRASAGTVLLIAEAANRTTVGAKRQRYSEARGECGEVAACSELMCNLGLASQKDAEVIIVLAARVGAMLTRLIQRFS